jgi:hypothetical protein
MGEDWVRWHEAYDVPGGSLARRLQVVRRRVRDGLRAQGGRPGRVLSLCAGDGRDLLPILSLAYRADRPAAEAVLVENDPTLAARVEEGAAALCIPNVRVTVGDAADPTVYADVLPADLLLCGIFGNISWSDIVRTVEAVPALLAAGGHVVWTCGAADPDLRPAVRQLFTDSGLE